MPYYTCENLETPVLVIIITEHGFSEGLEDTLPFQGYETIPNLLDTPKLHCHEVTQQARGSMFVKIPLIESEAFAVKALHC